MHTTETDQAQAVPPVRVGDQTTVTGEDGSGNPVSLAGYVTEVLPVDTIPWHTLGNEPRTPSVWGLTSDTLRPAVCAAFGNPVRDLLPWWDDREPTGVRLLHRADVDSTWHLVGMVGCVGCADVDQPRDKMRPRTWASVGPSTPDHDPARTWGSVGDQPYTCTKCGARKVLDREGMRTLDGSQTLCGACTRARIEKAWADQPDGVYAINATGTAGTRTIGYVRKGPAVETSPGREYDADDRCVSCGAHIADPHDPGCPAGDPADGYTSGW